MEAYVLDWVNLLLRWAHVIVAIAWIGSSFYFVFLDNSLTRPTAPELQAKGVDGELWAVHGGGFYHPQKYMVAPQSLPDVIGAIIYLDPPYITDDGFTSYSGEFGMFDEKRLAKLVEYISPRNKVMVSNSFHPVVNDLYFGFTMHVVQATRRINRDGSGRGKVDEVIITNYVIQNQ